VAAVQTLSYRVFGNLPQGVTVLPNISFERTSLLSSRFALGQRAAQLSR
jgi:hypothetical protein